MDSLTVKPASSAARTSAVRRNAVVTDLAPSQSVTAAAASGKADTGPSPDPDSSHMGDVVLDPQSREVLYRTVDARARRVVRQVPEVAARRLKAYTRSSKGGAKPRDPLADIKV